MPAATVACALALWVDAAGATSVCAKHGGIVYAGADSRGGSVHIICADGREFDV